MKKVSIGIKYQNEEESKIFEDEFLEKRKRS